jgi:hypothetical protein
VVSREGARLTRRRAGIAGKSIALLQASVCGTIALEAVAVQSARGVRWRWECGRRTLAAGPRDGAGPVPAHIARCLSRPNQNLTYVRSKRTELLGDPTPRLSRSSALSQIWQRPRGGSDRADQAARRRRAHRIAAWLRPRSVAKPPGSSSSFLVFFISLLLAGRLARDDSGRAEEEGDGPRPAPYQG